MLTKGIAPMMAALAVVRGLVAPSRAFSGARSVAVKAEADFSRMDLRVGTITDAWDHPDSEKLIVEEISLGEEDEVVQVVSGLRAFYAAADLVGKRCVVVANLPKAKLGGVESSGMVLCGSADDKARVEILEPPPGAEDGERAFVDGADGAAATPNQVKKKKLWPPVAERLALVGGVATYGGAVIETSEGPCTCATIADGPIS